MAGDNLDLAGGRRRLHLLYIWHICIYIYLYISIRSISLHSLLQTITATTCHDDFMQKGDAGRLATGSRRLLFLLLPSRSLRFGSVQHSRAKPRNHTTGLSNPQPSRAKQSDSKSKSNTNPTQTKQLTLMACRSEAVVEQHVCPRSLRNPARLPSCPMLLAMPATSAARDMAPLVLFRKFISPVEDACSANSGTSASASASYQLEEGTPDDDCDDGAPPLPPFATSPPLPLADDPLFPFPAAAAADFPVPSTPLRQSWWASLICSSSDLAKSGCGGGRGFERHS